MGACNFATSATGKTPQEAFDSAVSQAQYDHGHGGYTGTIAEKDSFVMITETKASILALIDRAMASKTTNEEWLTKKRAEIEALEEVPPRQIANLLVVLDDPRATEKYGPAGCIALSPNKWIFFGVAAE